MHDDAVSPAKRRALLALAPAAARGFYLAGGTALCLRLAHRQSIDLAFFRPGEFDAEQLLRELEAAGVHGTNVRSQPGALWLDVEGVETSFMPFRYPTLKEPDTALGLPIASLDDIAAMKVEAISSRGARKDFVDLYFICQVPGWTLSKALCSYSARFASANPDIGHRVKALTYFDDAEREPELLMLTPVSWHEVRTYFEREVELWWLAAGA
jgi:hypothetical protein